MQPPAAEFEDLLSYLRTTRGFDFSSYKRATLMRRMQKRLMTVNCSTFSDYLDYLQVHQEEFSLLFNTILINVTGFFRDPEAWSYIKQEVIPRNLERRTDREQIRIWSAGCASGEEAYSLAILLAEAMGPEQFKSRVKLYATDLDNEALQQSRQATYSQADVAEVDPALIDKYFEKVGDRFVFDRELRRAVIFGKHDLIVDAPISRVDLLVCRNTLMYFNAEVQEKILARFHFAICEGGFLFLGKAETMLTHGNIFTPLELKHRIFVKNGNTNNRDRMLAMGQRNGSEGDAQSQVRLRDLALDASPVAQIVVAFSGNVVLINERARTRFGLTLRDVGRPLQDLEISYKPVDLRSLIDQVFSQRRPHTLKEVEWPQQDGTNAYLDINLTPLSEGSASVSTCLTFTEVTEFKRLQEELQHFNQELETAYEELQSTNEELQTTNEELQSTVEELETTNEELHSTNEELETMNEELQSANEELEAINEELTRRTTDLNQSNAFQTSILSSLGSGVIVVDGEFKVLAWNERSHDMWGLRSDEVKGKHLLNLDIGLPVDQLRQPIRSAMMEADGPVEFESDCVNRRGKTFRCKVSCSPLRDHNAQPTGAIVSVEEMV